MTRKIYFLILAAVLSFGTASLATPSFAAEPAVYTSWKNNVGAGGYDVVSFFSGVPAEGKSEFTTSYMGADWQFSTQANLDLFQTNPEAFAPQYGGYCAWAIAKGKLARGRPEHWNIENGKLYLNYNKRIKKRWEKDKQGFISLGDAMWPAILDK
ncbi:MAG: YHS domain-containing (seleno)protein [Litorimonas sp.]